MVARLSFPIRYRTRLVVGVMLLVGLFAAWQVSEASNSQRPALAVESINADFSASPRSGVVPLTVQFYDTSTGDVDYWNWEFGDGTGSNAENPAHTYKVSGSFTVTLKVWNNSDEESTEVIPNYITVYDPPDADFTGSPTSGAAPLSVVFTDASTGLYDDCAWNFGDGETSSSCNPTHEYDSAGVYDVSLEVSYQDSSDTKTRNDYIIVNKDEYEDNDSKGDAIGISVGGSLSNLTFYPQDDVDWFRFYGKDGHTYEVRSTVSIGVDTEMEVFGPGENGASVGENDDVAWDDKGSLVTFIAEGEGYYYIKLVYSGLMPDEGLTYQVEVDEVEGTTTPTATATKTPKPTSTDEPDPTPIGGADPYEPNYNFDNATVLALGVQYDNLNFVPWAGDDQDQPDNDFFRVWVKPELSLTCETFNLTAGTDTNMILYLGPSFEQGGPGNDDRSPGDYSSRVTWYSTYTGWLYILVGPVWSGIPPTQLSPFKYSIKCTVGQEPTATPAPTATRPPTLAATLPTYTPLPTNSPTVTPTPGPTNTRSAEPSSTPSPTPTPTIPPLQLNILPLPTPTPASPLVTVITIDVLVYYDANQNMNPELEEGIQDLAVAVYDTVNNELAAFGYTGDSGGLHIGPLSVTGAVRVEVPLLGFSQRVVGPMEQIEIRIAPQPLPSAIP